MSLLTIVQDTCRSTGKTPPSVVVSSSDATILEMYVLANISGAALAREYDFPELQRQATFSATSSVYQGEIIGTSASQIVADSDYLRMVPETFWNRAIDTPFSLATPAQWSQLTAFNTIPYPMRFIIIGKGLYLGPSNGPASGAECAFMYYSNKFCESSAGVKKNRWTDDTDVGIIPEQILTLDLIWRWKQAKGLQYAEDMETAQRAIEQYCGATGGRRLLMLGGGSNSFQWMYNIPESNWG